MKEKKINFPDGFCFETPELKEFSYNKFAMVQGASGAKKVRTITPSFSGGTTFEGFSKPTNKK